MIQRRLSTLLLAAVVVASFAAAQSGSDKAVDPVCGMTVVKARAAATFDYKGSTYYFCSTSCKDAFAKDPAKYAKETTPSPAPAAAKPACCPGMGQAAAPSAAAAPCSCAIPAGAIVAAETIPDGVVVRVTSKDPTKVEALRKWAEGLQAKPAAAATAAPDKAPCPMAAAGKTPGGCACKPAAATEKK